MSKDDTSPPDAPLPSLAPFWRRGRQQFVELTSDEAEAAGLDGKALSALTAAQQIERYKHSGRIIIRVTEAGMAAFRDQQGEQLND